MRVLQIHNTYQHAGGEDKVLVLEKNLLELNGLQVQCCSVDNKNISGLLKKFSAALQVYSSPRGKKIVADRLKIFPPDIVHVHNFFPLLSPSIYDACLEAGVPVVQTLHNYRTICPGALLMRNGNICELCVKGSAYQSVLHGCYKGSSVGTFAVARMVEKHRILGTWKHKVNKFVALTEFAKNKFVEAGFPAHKIMVKPNFVVDTVPPEEAIKPNRAGALFVGRLSEEKGLKTLLNAWEYLDVPLRVAGAGPLQRDLANLSGDNVDALGSLNQNSVRKEMRHAAFLVMPSEWYEGFPMVLVEAFSQGLPVIASGLGSMAEIIEDGVTGLHFETGNASDLAAKVRWMNDNPEECRQMGRNARNKYEQKYTPATNYQMLMNIYRQAIVESSSKIPLFNE